MEEYDGTAPSAETLEEAQARSDAGFRAELETLVNRYSRENGSDTPDFILADYLTACLAAWDAGLQAREKWYGRPIGGTNLLTGEPRDTSIEQPYRDPDAPDLSS